MDHTAASPNRVRLKIAVRGAVQGVGFRPFVFRLATRLQLTGGVHNSAQGVFIEVEGPRDALEQFLLRLEVEKPPRSFIQSLEATWLESQGFTDFEIRASDPHGPKNTLVLPDIATCPDCLREIFDPANRRYHYPFTNCTHCGPRFSIIEALPYDRANTSMKAFPMCPQCQAEYNDPQDRRFHAQPNACPECGPHVELWEALPAGDSLESCPAVPRSRDDEAILAAAAAIRRGQIVAVKGLGGFHLMVDPRNETAVQRLRERKHRDEKPLAVMFPSLTSIRTACEVSPLEERLLRSPEAPIVLLRRLARPHPGPLPQERENNNPPPEKSQTGAAITCCEKTDEPDTPLRSPEEKAGSPLAHFEIAAAVAPGNPYLGVMLPYTPLHHLLLAELAFPVVATSGNLSDEPICTDETEARERLRGIADVFLVHNRPIVRHGDDSVVRVMLGREMVLRRARGFAPLPISLTSAAGGTPTILAVGAHLKNAVALAVGESAFLSQHIGDLETEPAYQAFLRVTADLQQLFAAAPDVITHDLHPDYLSTQFAIKSAGRGGPKAFGVQHHLAHVLSCMAENEWPPPVLGVSWDGTGYGPDGTIWGGEFFLVTEHDAVRVAHLRPFRLPGGDKAVKEPRRVALGLLYEHFGSELFARPDLTTPLGFAPAELTTLRTMLERGVNSPRTSSVGRLFDAVAALAGGRQQIRFEGQAAMELEFALAGNNTDEFYPLPLLLQQPAAILDWAPLLEALLADVRAGVPWGLISAKFHNGLAEAIVAISRHFGQKRVALSGGCFQNRYLTERTVHRLQAEGFQPGWHQRVPPNDGGIALGQVVAARRRKE